MSTSRHEMRWKLLILAVAFAAVGCAVALNAPRPVLVGPNVVDRKAPAPRQVLTVVPGPRLNHAQHADLGLGCSDCHEFDEDTGAIGYPEVDFCLDCHEDMQEDEEVPEAQRIENVFYRDEEPAWRRAVLEYGPDIRFSHKGHVTDPDECSACHDMTENVRYARKLQTKPQCLSCHQEYGASNACEVCHVQTRMNVAPANHAFEWELRHGPAVYAAESSGADPTCQYCHVDADYCNDCHQGQLPTSHEWDWERRHGQAVWQAGGPAEARCTFCHRDPEYCNGCHQSRLPDSHKHLWIQRHGTMARAGDLSGQAQCAFCHHEPAFCEDCHRDMKPRDHTALFRTRTHGLAAAIDRTRCRTCHETDFCVRCHESTPPRSHRGMWARGRNTHCIVCHYPIQREPQCVVCHKQNPAHETAAPQPPGHNPASNCRACHNAIGQGGADPLRHVDNGQACQLCHD